VEICVAEYTLHVRFRRSRLEPDPESSLVTLVSPPDTGLDLAAVRAAFPALTRQHNGHPVAYFDGPGGTQVPRRVVQAMTEYLLLHNANTHWVYPTSVETDAAIAGARAAMADFLGAQPSEIAFGANMTTLTFHLARGLAREWGPGDEVVITELDHHANIAPWQAIARERGVTLYTVPFIRETGQLDYGALERRLSKKTRLLAIGAASNALGTVNAIRHAIKMARNVGALTFIDAVHYAAHASVDVAEIGCDFLACSAYKFYGPHIGIMYGRQPLLAAVDVPKLEPAPDSAPERLETGTLNHEGIVGAAAAVEFLAGLGAGTTRRGRLQDAGRRLHAQGQMLIERLWYGLEAIEGVTLYGPTPDQPRTPTLAFTFDGMTSEEVARHLAERGVFVSNGDFYASTVIGRLGLSDAGVVRAGCACYTSPDEVDRLIEGVRELR
jgi:cysteine desulfurase family protein (TIGR01976 family)